jgi:hypothetical protein
MVPELFTLPQLSLPPMFPVPPTLTFPLPPLFPLLVLPVPVAVALRIAVSAPNFLVHGKKANSRRSRRPTRRRRRLIHTTVAQTRTIARIQAAHGAEIHRVRALRARLRHARAQHLHRVGLQVRATVAALGRGAGAAVVDGGYATERGAQGSHW